MSDQPRDWDREMAEIDKAIARMPAPPNQPAGVARSATATTAGAAAAAPAAFPVRRRDRAATWLWMVLGLVLAAALPLWPYAAECGAGLFGYLAVIAVLVLSAVLGLRASWRARQGKANALGILLLVWGLTLAATAVLPRIGYARASATWMCPAAPPPQG